jgi:hypothetical protein
MANADAETPSSSVSPEGSSLSFDTGGDMDEDAAMGEPGQLTPSRMTFGLGVLDDDSGQGDALATPQQQPPRHNHHRRSYSSAAAFSAFTMSHLDDDSPSTAINDSPSANQRELGMLKLDKSISNLQPSFVDHQQQATPQTISYSFANTFTSRGHTDHFTFPASSTPQRRPTLSHVASAPSLSLVATLHGNSRHEQPAGFERLSLSTSPAGSPPSPDAYPSSSSCGPSPSATSEHFLSAPPTRPHTEYEYDRKLAAASAVAASSARHMGGVSRERPSVSRRATISGGSWSPSSSDSVPMVPSQSPSPPFGQGSGGVQGGPTISTGQASAAAGVLMRYLQEQQRSRGVVTPGDYAAVSDLWRRLIASADPAHFGLAESPMK